MTLYIVTRNKKKQIREKKKRKTLMALVEVYGGQRILAFELATADNYGNSHSNSGDDSVENEVMLMIIAMKKLRMVLLRMKSVLN